MKNDIHYKLTFAVLAAFAFAYLAFGLSGCKTTEGDRDAIARIAVTYATLKVVDGDLERAAKIRQVATLARSALSGDRAPTVAALIDIARKEIRWDKLDAADTVLVQLLLSEIERSLLERLGEGELVEGGGLVVSKVLKWIEDTLPAL